MWGPRVLGSMNVMWSTFFCHTSMGSFVRKPWDLERAHHALFLAKALKLKPCKVWCRWEA